MCDLRLAQYLMYLHIFIIDRHGLVLDCLTAVELKQTTHGQPIYISYTILSGSLITRALPRPIYNTDSGRAMADQINEVRKLFGMEMIHPHLVTLLTGPFI